MVPPSTVLQHLVDKLRCPVNPLRICLWPLWLLCSGKIRTFELQPEQLPGTGAGYRLPRSAITTKEVRSLEEARHDSLSKQCAFEFEDHVQTQILSRMGLHRRAGQREGESLPRLLHVHGWSSGRHVCGHVIRSDARDPTATGQTKHKYGVMTELCFRGPTFYLLTDFAPNEWHDPKFLAIEERMSNVCTAEEVRPSPSH